MRGRAEWAGIPILALADPADPSQADALHRAGFKDCQDKFDQTAMLESVARLSAALTGAEREPAHAGAR